MVYCIKSTDSGYEGISLQGSATFYRSGSWFVAVNIYRSACLDFSKKKEKKEPKALAGQPSIRKVRERERALLVVRDSRSSHEFGSEEE